MSTPNPALVAASPILKQVIADVIQAATTTLTGPATQAGARAVPAFGILVNQLMLLAPELLNAEQGVALQDIVTQLNGLAAKLP